MQTNKFKPIQENINDQQQKNKDCHLSSETPTIRLTREHQSNNKEVIGINSVPSEDKISLYITNDFFKNIFFTQLAIIKQEELFEILMIINPFKKKFLKEAFLLHLKYEISYSNNPNIDNYYTLQQVKELDYLINDNLTENSGLNNFKAGFVTLFNAQSIEQDSDVFISPYNDQIVEFTEETMNKLSPIINKLVEKAIQEAGGIQPNYYIVNIVTYRRMPFMSRLYLEWTFM
ncbi:hypothetical protein RhiirC2_848343 [Rhizophagus irregularis]|uniref:Uncharacterized protein n=1 Tax=Rhizophagus irregularis TaxID=588596 RepID=A0A2N1NF37_9GLOM|nr:hypothetical protein RhiirC2_848343 [Rhizophagus irregularis]